MVKRLETLTEQLYALSQNLLVNEGTKTEMATIDNMEQAMDNVLNGLKEISLSESLIQHASGRPSDEEFLLAHENDPLFDEMHQFN